MFRERARHTVLGGLFGLLLPLLAPSEARAADPDKVEWSDDWRRVNVAEAVATVLLTVGDTEFDRRVPYPDHATWRSPILFDQWARNVFHGRTASIQQIASTGSDWMYQAGTLVPLLVDDYIATLSVHQNADVALQMLFIDLEAYSVSGLISLTAEHAVGRARPYTTDCNARDPSTGRLLQTCGGGNDARSFYSGHAAATSTTAGLVCIEHQHLPLFGGGFADLAPCLFMIGVSVTAGFFRLIDDEHWASDVMAGWIAGTAAGYLLPAALHYGFRDGHPPEIKMGDARALPALLPYPGGLGAGLLGVF